MIYLEKNKFNDVVVTLQEKSDIYALSGTQPFYLWSLSSDTTNQIINFVATNIATTTARTRYDEFTFIETGSTFTNLTGGTINLIPGIFWSYTAYEQFTRNNLNPNLAYGIVETGKLFVKVPDEAPFTYYSPTGTTNIITYSVNH